MENFEPLYLADNIYIKNISKSFSPGKVVSG